MKACLLWFALFNSKNLREWGCVGGCMCVRKEMFAYVWNSRVYLVFKTSVSHTYETDVRLVNSPTYRFYLLSLSLSRLLWCPGQVPVWEESEKHQLLRLMDLRSVSQKQKQEWTDRIKMAGVQDSASSSSLKTGIAPSPSPSAPRSFPLCFPAAKSGETRGDLERNWGR